jgi:hypothetical protein
MEYVAGQALRMNAHERRLQGRGDIAQPERYCLLRSSRSYAFKPINSEMSKPGWEIRFGNFSKLNIRQTILVSSATPVTLLILKMHESVDWA